MNVQNKRLRRDLNHSEASRLEAERKAAAQVTRLEDAASQVEETKSENQSLTNQVFGCLCLTGLCAAHQK